MQLNLSGIIAEVEIIQSLKSGNNMTAIPPHIENIKKILEDNKFSNENNTDSASLEDLYWVLQTLEVDSILDILQSIENAEYETLVINKGKIEFASGWITEIKAELAALQTAYSGIIQTYKAQYADIQSILSGAITSINQMCTNDACNTAPLASVSALIGTSNNSDITIDTNGIDFENRTDAQINAGLKKAIPNSLTSFFHIKGVDGDLDCPDESGNGCTGSADIKYGKLTATEFDT